MLIFKEGLQSVLCIITKEGFRIESGRFWIHQFYLIHNISLLILLKIILTSQIYVLCNWFDLDLLSLGMSSSTSLNALLSLSSTTTGKVSSEWHESSAALSWVFFCSFLLLFFFPFLIFFLFLLFFFVSSLSYFAS